MSRTTLTLALICLVALAGCVATGPGGPASPTQTTPPPDTATATATPPPTGGGDEPPLDFDGENSTLAPDERPHTVRLTNDGTETKDVRLRVVRDDTLVFVETFRSFPQSTVLGELDHVGNYTLALSVVDESASVTATVPATSFDCNSRTTTFDLSEPAPTVTTVSTEMGCEASAE